jgi:hypothetical protein
MNIARSRTKNTRSTIAKLLLGSTYAVVILGVSMGPALAAQDQNRDNKNDNRGHDDRDHHDDRNWDRDRGYYYAPPPAVYAPPPVYYSPYYAPPQQYYASPGINIVVPLNFR